MSIAEALSAKNDNWLYKSKKQEELYVAQTNLISYVESVVGVLKAKRDTIIKQATKDAGARAIYIKAGILPEGWNPGREKQGDISPERDMEQGDGNSEELTQTPTIA
jgi:hypothetical protein